MNQFIKLQNLEKRSVWVRLSSIQNWYVYKGDTRITCSGLPDSECVLWVKGDVSQLLLDAMEGEEV